MWWFPVACTAPDPAAPTASTSAPTTSSSPRSTGDTAAGPAHTSDPQLAPCPTEGDGAVVAPSATCVVFTPAESGADPEGVDAETPSYALAPDAGGDGVLVLFLTPSLGTPAFSIAAPDANVYTAAVEAGHHLLAPAYRNDQVVGVSCRHDDACYLDTRMALLTGTATGDVPFLIARNLLPSEGIYARTALALAHLAQRWPGGGWDQFLDPSATDPAAAVRWDRVFVVGHSQGGGHGALIAKLQPIARLVTLSSPCDAVDGAPASWQFADASWAADPAAVGYGFAAPDDPVCPAHLAVWDALGYAAQRRFDDVADCAGASSHTATTQCVENIDRVRELLLP